MYLMRFEHPLETERLQSQLCQLLLEKVQLQPTENHFQSVVDLILWCTELPAQR